MRILFNDLIYNATLAADTADGNYPVTNLQSDFQAKLYKATQASAVITMTLPSVSTINCCYFGLTNATSAVLTLYSSGNVLLGTVTLDVSRGGKSFASVSSVAYAKLTLAGSATIYLGNIGIGYNYTMPEPDAGIVLTPIDNNSYDYSDYGQSYVNYIDTCYQIEPQYSRVDVDKYNAITLLVDSLRHPAWVDPYEENTGIINPMWCQIIKDTEPSQLGRLYTFTHTYRQVK